MASVTSFSTEGIFPENNKVVIQSHKKGPTNDANNHHPISLHSVFSKIIEKLMVVRLTTYLELHDLDIQLPIPHR